MSTIPLSMREGYGQTLSGDDAPVAVPADDGKLDALIDSVSETIANRDRADAHAEVLRDVPANDGDEQDSWRALKAKLDDPDHARENSAGSPLDRALKTAVDRRASQEVESADFHQSRPWREALVQRYDGRIGIGDLLETFADWHERLKTDPRAAADTIASAYLGQSPYALPEAARAAARSGVQAGASDETAGQKLNRVLAAAIDRHHGQGDGEPKAFVASARHRAVLKEMFPGMTYAEACRRVVKLDGDLHRDPVATAARLAATYGMALTTSQQAGERQQATDQAATEQATAAPVAAHDAQRIVTEAAQGLPDLGAIETDVVTILTHRDFVHGPDMRQNLLRAYRVAQLARHEQQQRRAQRSAVPAGLDGRMHTSSIATASSF